MFWPDTYFKVYMKRQYFKIINHVKIIWKTPGCFGIMRKFVIHFFRFLRLDLRFLKTADFGHSNYKSVMFLTQTYRLCTAGRVKLDIPYILALSINYLLSPFCFAFKIVTLLQLKIVDDQVRFPLEVNFFLQKFFFIYLFFFLKCEKWKLFCLLQTQKIDFKISMNNRLGRHFSTSIIHLRPPNALQ